MITELISATKMSQTFDVSVVDPWQLSLDEKTPSNDTPDPKKKPEVEPEKLPKEDPGVQPNTTPKKDDDDDSNDDDDDYVPYEEPEIGDDPDEITRKTTIM
jgi:hypothetical protein